LVNSNYSDAGLFNVPNAFSPNYDGLNDCFGVKHWGPVDQFELMIFNRWGERLFFTKKNDCWNGFYKGVLQPVGVYVYILKAKGVCGEVFKKGTFSLIR
jgi:gliding motility-associated-like protein